jgi:hypothetical protein
LDAISEFIQKKMENSIDSSFVLFNSSGNCYSGQETNDTEGADTNYTTLAWIGVSDETKIGVYDTSKNYYTQGWSGLADITKNTDTVNKPTYIESTGSDMATVVSNIKLLNNNSVLYAGIFFLNTSIDDSCQDFWLGATKKIYPIGNGASGTNIPISNSPDYISEHYVISHSAYAIRKEIDGSLQLYYNFFPWNGETYLNARNKSIIANNIESFNAKYTAGIVQLTICAKEDDRLNILSDKLCKTVAIVLN